MAYNSYLCYLGMDLSPSLPHILALKWLGIWNDLVYLHMGSSHDGPNGHNICPTHPSNVSHISRLVSKHSTPSPKIGWYLFKSYLVHWKQSNTSAPLLCHASYCWVKKILHSWVQCTFSMHKMPWSKKAFDVLIYKLLYVVQFMPELWITLRGLHISQERSECARHLTYTAQSALPACHISWKTK